MIEPVSLDLFPSDVCLSSVDYGLLSALYSVADAVIDVRARLLFQLGQRWEYYAYFSAASVRDYNFSLAYLLDSLGGLGGVW
ncbi:protein of unknown function [Acidithiobacillus ferrivorans]|uniref:Uncharacterized protein n=1 Tax=Acidithiobacillus ferrivorans TaxID=160808 RepID=A0A060UUB2_9PROT|nr:hypothetical protein [Acidithiobacillus ferrivorans]CDQ10368.1 hypothetical protein AFERRI_400149 [Acidithiobacillus ferrivorans]SMH64395.1 protein of unknown function [Acidithiobacillus ferrivorans]